MIIDANPLLLLKNLLIFASLSFIVSCAAKPIDKDVEISHYYQAKTSKPYDDVLAELEIAISEQNFRITGHSRVGKVIRTRGTTEFPEYDTIQFCNLTHAKTLLQISPHAIRHMPCNVVIYEFEDQTIVKIRLIPVDSGNTELNQFAVKMNAKLQQIVDFAVEE
jgi:uncharacterized protein (DUF302 family)